MGRDSVACGRKWRGMWVEMARFVGVEMGRRVGRDGLAWGSAEGRGLWGELELHVGGA